MHGSESFSIGITRLVDLSLAASHETVCFQDETVYRVIVLLETASVYFDGDPDYEESMARLADALTTKRYGDDISNRNLLLDVSRTQNQSISSYLQALDEAHRVQRLVLLQQQKRLSVTTRPHNFTA